MYHVIITISCSLKLCLSFLLSGEAIEKMLQEKKISSKINYEVLRSLNIAISSSNNQSQKNQELSATTVSEVDNTASFNKPLVNNTTYITIMMK